MTDADESGESSARWRTIALPAEVVRARAAHRSAGPRVSHESKPTLDGLSIVRWLLAIPTLVVAAMALFAAIAALRSLWSVMQLVVALQFEAAASMLSALDISGRILLGAVGYFALLVTLRTVASGLHANGWKRVGGFVAVIVALPAAWLFIAGAGLASDVAPFNTIPTDLWRGGVSVLLLQVIALAVVTARRSSRSLAVAKARHVALTSYNWQPYSATEVSPSTETVPLPMVRFGPDAEGVQPEEDRPEEDRPEFRISGLFVAPSDTTPATTE